MPSLALNGKRNVIYHFQHNKVWRDLLSSKETEVAQLLKKRINISWFQVTEDVFGTSVYGTKKDGIEWLLCRLQGD